jgi:outer membrane protein OmpA-like peptidoglycan-associated protein
MTTTQKYLLVAAGAVGMLWLLTRTSSAATLPSTGGRRISAGPGDVVTSSGGQQETHAAPDVPAPPERAPSFSVMFDNGQSTVSGQRLADLQAWIRRPIKNTTRFELHGYSSRSGSEATNLTMSRNRVQFVTREITTATGLSVEGFSHGEIHDLPDDQARRVDIYAWGGA